ncbi:ubiquitin carboxyl-terminal hydrolase 4 [Grus japonensis]|uniref:Ubiquitin carboxyl-terminal hydrolase 4 n=1 Tax=Grus japonensis TaxID=30415 RepID=A0ABC9VZN1_GRUJA
MVWNFTPNKLQEPDEVMEYLKGKFYGCSKEAQLIALCWALASTYLLDSRQRHQGEERENRATGTVATTTPVTGTVATPTPATGTAATQTLASGAADEQENQPMPVSVTPIQKKKYTKKSVHLVRDDDEPGPSREQEEEAEPEVICEKISAAIQLLLQWTPET